MIEREGRHRISRLPEDNQPDTIVLALADELADHLLHRIDQDLIIHFDQQPRFLCHVEERLWQQQSVERIADS